MFVGIVLIDQHIFGRFNQFYINSFDCTVYTEYKMTAYSSMIQHLSERENILLDFVLQSS